MEPELVGSLLALLQQVHVPGIALGRRAFVLANDVCKSLSQLHASPVSAEELLRALKGFEFLSKCHERREDGTRGDVHTLAAALGGCRILREQLARLHGVPEASQSEFIVQGSRTLRLWRGAREKLFLRHAILQ